MKLAAPVLSLIWLSACSFPDFELPAAGGSSGAPGVASCADGERNGDESGIDCGMQACSRACPAGQGCDGDDDCVSQKCEDSLCQAPRCDDSVHNGLETDVDCGGDSGCAPCGEGSLCNVSADCDGGACVRRSCRAPSCKDGLQNGEETDVDCGAGCDPCAVGQTCSSTEDCDGVACINDICQAAACVDGVWNQDETDRDCGGSCPSACADGLRCIGAEDCASEVCLKATLRCAEPTCGDGVRNGAEPTTDCGGSCSDKCSLLDRCDAASDCETGSCVDATCVPPAATGQILSPVSWVTSASHTFPGSDSKHAIDGIAGTDWTTGSLQTPGMWFIVDMQSEQVFFSIEIDCINTRDDSAEAVDIWLSSDGTFADAPVKQNVDGQDQMVLGFSKPQVARYIKISLARGSSHWWRMDEIRVRQ